MIGPQEVNRVALVTEASRPSADTRSCRGALYAALRIVEGIGPAVEVRHSVSTKILIEPPAVRTYSTFPLAIQL